MSETWLNTLREIWGTLPSVGWLVPSGEVPLTSKGWVDQWMIVGEVKTKYFQMTHEVIYYLQSHTVSPIIRST